MTLEEISEFFKKSGLTLGSVESFTGGLFASTMTSLSGASKFFKGSVVTYATEEKVRVLGINQELVDTYGVVSEQVSKEMATKGQKLLNVDCCVSFTGNAGPSAMEGKPVGEIYIGIAYFDKCEVFKFNLDGDRKSVQNKAILIAFDLLEKIFSHFSQFSTLFIK